MKSLNIIYWVSTGLIALFMGMSGFDHLLMTEGAVKLIATDLGYPEYIIPFLGVAKIVGVAGILLPVGPRFKEWAYAGLFFDLIGAVYSMVAYSAIAGTGFDYMLLTLLVPFAILGLSYGAHHRRLQLTGQGV